MLLPIHNRNRKRRSELTAALIYGTLPKWADAKPNLTLASFSF